MKQVSSESTDLKKENEHLEQLVVEIATPVEKYTEEPFLIALELRYKE